MKFRIFAFSLCMLALNSNAQNSKKSSEGKDPNTEQVFTMVEQMPEYPGGEQALYQYLSNNIHYPDLALKNGKEGTVYVKFVVDESGAVRDANVTRKVDPMLDIEALRVIKAMPAWQPGKNNGRAVNVYFQIPIKFMIPKEEAKEAPNK